MSGLAVILLGAGGHARVLLETLNLRGIPVLGVACPEFATLGETWFGCPVLGDDASELLNMRGPAMLINGIGSTRSVENRRKTFLQFRQSGHRFAQVIHPTSWVSSSALLGEGVQIMAGAIVQAGARIGDNVIVNTRAVVEHDCEVGAHVHLASGSLLCGSVHIGDGTHVGAGATVIQNVTLGQNCLVAAGAVVVRKADDGARLIGVPAREDPYD
jgi:sugar O-acyltransferase (sialic acid O-acetyltransferase NeuD family)